MNIIDNTLRFFNIVDEIRGKNKKEIYEWIMKNPKKATILVDFVRFSYAEEL